MASEEKEDEKLPLISYRKLKTNDREELDRLRFALVDGEHGFFQLDVDDEVDVDVLKHCFVILKTSS